MRVIIMQGIPGSGKDTYIRNNIMNNGETLVTVVSADDYFVNTWNDEYVFVPSKIGEAHKTCLLSFIKDLQNSCAFDDILVVNNTNTTALEMAPYVAIAAAYDIPVEIVTLLCEAEVGAKRNVHGVPLHACMSMASRIKTFAIPQFWNVKRTVIPQIPV